MSLKIREYWVDEPGDSLFTKYRKRLTRRPIPAFPRVVQIETIGVCNVSCVWCPYGKLEPAPPAGKMTWDQYEALIDECAGHTVRRLSPYLTNEPFLDKDLPERIRMTKKKMPATKIVVTTNGTMLTPDRVDQILSLDGALHAIYISFQGIEKEGYEKTVGKNGKFEVTLANVNHLIEQMRLRNLDRPKVWITMVDTNLIDARKALKYWKARGVSAKYTALENRGGNMKEAQSWSVHKLDYFTECERLMKQAYISWDGEMVICCTDFGRKHVLGNVFKDGITGVWNGPIARNLRRRYITGRIHTIDLCSVCEIDKEREVEA